ncbi:MAG: hypothetical protein JSS75_05895 [Bacteroidetes bacterium]|nr:hypothetical protein [Bacteroidota bacterium]
MFSTFVISSGDGNTDKFASVLWIGDELCEEDDDEVRAFLDTLLAIQIEIIDSIELGDERDGNPTYA